MITALAPCPRCGVPGRRREERDRATCTTQGCYVLSYRPSDGAELTRLE